MITTDNKQLKQNLYIRKLNGLGEKISVRDSLRVGELKQVVRSLRSLEAVGMGGRDFNLIYKGRNITQKSDSTLRELNIPSDGIIHLVFANEQDRKSQVIALNSLNSSNRSTNNKIAMSKSSFFPNNFPKTQQQPSLPPLSLRIYLNNEQRTFESLNPNMTVLDFKKIIAIKLNLVYQSLILSHLGTQMLNEKMLRQYQLQNQTLISVKFNLNNSMKAEKKTLQTRMVSSVTFSDENNQPNQQQGHGKNGNNSNNSNSNSNGYNNNITSQFNPLTKLLTSSSNSIPSEKDQNNNSDQRIGSKLSSMIMTNNNRNNTMYKSQITSFGKSQGVSKAALMFKNALHQKIIETQSVVSGQFSQQASMSGSSDPNFVSVIVKNQQQTKQFVFECLKSHQIMDIKDKLLEIQRQVSADRLQISLEEDLFQSIDLNKSGCVTLNEIVKKMGKERAVFIYRII